MNALEGGLFTNNNFFSSRLDSYPFVDVKRLWLFCKVAGIDPGAGRQVMMLIAAMALS
jgi:hypothetical protein